MSGKISCWLCGIRCFFKIESLWSINGFIYIYTSVHEPEGHYSPQGHMYCYSLWTHWNCIGLNASNGISAAKKNIKEFKILSKVHVPWSDYSGRNYLTLNRWPLPGKTEFDILSKGVLLIIIILLSTNFQQRTFALMKKWKICLL